ncbi:hypothetical protein [Mycolicibacterium iranicum]|uniref:hypothetical protein n=1 Tax=Mycolicibacterium iranicum TaxID=912594 RepID=UPI0013A5428E|nr:hypothetical protein [Mycolicibacterium iranicum]
MRVLPQESHADLGLLDDGDNTEDLRTNSRTAPGTQVRQHLAGTAHTHKSL